MVARQSKESSSSTTNLS